MTAATRTKLRTEDRQAELVQAALGLAAERSPAEITTADLAQAIGITQGGVFKHFASKEAIWLAVIEWAHRALLDRLQRAAQTPQDSALEALRSVFMAHIGFVQQYPGVPRLVFQELQHARPTPLKDRVQALMTDYRTLVGGLLQQARAGGQISPEVDPQGAVVLFMGAVQGLVMQSLMTGKLQALAHQAESVFDIFEAGLSAMPEPSFRTHR